MPLLVVNPGLAWTKKTQNFFPDSYKKNVFRKDRNKNGGGVFISVHDKFNSTSVENSENNCELQWTEIQTKSKSVIFDHTIDHQILTLTHYWIWNLQ